MDSWNNLRLKMETALRVRNLTEALSHLNALISSASSWSDVANLLKNHKMGAIPTLHLLAPTIYREEDMPNLDKLIRIFTDIGYDINKTAQLQIPGRKPNGKTALLASVKNQNVVFVKCLLRYGARADIRDPQGLSACHWAIKTGNLKCMQTILEHVGSKLVTSALTDKGSSCGQIKLLSILHETVGNGHLDIIGYLMTQEKLGVNAKVKFLFKKVGGWISLKSKMEEALENGNVNEAVSNLTDLILSTCASSHPAVVPSLLRNHTVKDLPTLHFLARFPFQEEDIPHLDEFIKIFTDFHYDINKITGKVSCFPDVGNSGSTALLAAIEQRNLILVECLLRRGARTDIRDNSKFSVYHHAIKMGDLDCIQKLIELGNCTLASLEFEKNGEKEVHPVLHTAVDEGRTEMVRYLLTKEELGVDVNEEVIYKNVKREQPQCWESSYFSRPFTPLGRALFKGTTPIIQLLLNHPGARPSPSRFKELHYLLQSGDTEKALDLLQYFSDEELSTDMIGLEWALLCIHRSGFRMERIEFTKKLILEYVRSGWDANSPSTTGMHHGVRLFDDYERRVWIEQYTLLHLACFYSAPAIIKVLVEEVKVDVNCKFRGEMELTPLQILLSMKDFESAAYLIDKGADWNLMGIYDYYDSTLKIVSSIEILLRIGCDDGLALLDKMLAIPGAICLKADEFHLAIEGMNPTYCLKVLQHCTKNISQEDLNWMTEWKWSNGKCYLVKVSSLISLLVGCRPKWERNRIQDNLSLVDLIKLMTELGCDLNISRYKPTVLEQETTAKFPEPLIFYILRYDLVHRTSNLLLRTILQFDQLKLNVINEEGENPVEYLLREWNHRCSPRGGQTNSQPHRIVEAIRLLVSHGLDVSGIVIAWQFKYHNGSKFILKMLYRAGALILSQFFTSTFACDQFSGNLRKEKKELKRWKDEFDHGTGKSLKHMCILQARRNLKCIGDLKVLDEIPRSLKDTVLGTSGESTLSREVSECEEGFESEESSDDDDDSENDDFDDFYDPDFYSD